MKIEDFKLNQTEEIENINPFLSFSCGEYEKQIIGEIMLNEEPDTNIYKKFSK